MVLVTVGEHQAHDVVHALLDPGEIGEDQVNAGLAFLGEEDTAVHDQKFSPVFQDVMLRPTSPRPPSGITRRAPSSRGAGSLRFSYKDFIVPVCHVRVLLPASGDP